MPDAHGVTTLDIMLRSILDIHLPVMASAPFPRQLGGIDRLTPLVAVTGEKKPASRKPSHPATFGA
jgi:hypothetical protein